MSKPTAFFLRRARPEDVNVVHEIHSSAIQAGAEEVYPEEVRDCWAGAFNPENFPRNIQRMEFWVAEVPGKEGATRVCGFVAFDLKSRELDSLYIAPRGQGMGLGSYLLDFAEKTSRDAGLDDLWLDASLNAVGFYEKHGWRVVRKHARTRLGVDIPVVRMEKQFTD